MIPLLLELKIMRFPHTVVPLLFREHSLCEQRMPPQAVLLHYVMLVAVTLRWRVFRLLLNVLRGARGHPLLRGSCCWEAHLRNGHPRTGW